MALVEQAKSGGGKKNSGAHLKQMEARANGLVRDLSEFKDAFPGSLQTTRYETKMLPSALPSLAGDLSQHAGTRFWLQSLPLTKQPPSHQPLRLETLLVRAEHLYVISPSAHPARTGNP